jgi:hypothetical protein
MDHGARTRTRTWTVGGFPFGDSQISSCPTVPLSTAHHQPQPQPQPQSQSILHILHTSVMRDAPRTEDPLACCCMSRLGFALLSSLMDIQNSSRLEAAKNKITNTKSTWSEWGPQMRSQMQSKSSRNSSSVRPFARWMAFAPLAVRHAVMFQGSRSPALYASQGLIRAYIRGPERTEGKDFGCMRLLWSM